MKKDCNESGLLDWVTKKTLQQSNTGIRYKITTKPQGLDFADDFALNGEY